MPSSRYMCGGNCPPVVSRRTSISPTCFLRRPCPGPACSSGLLRRPQHLLPELRCSAHLLGLDSTVGDCLCRICGSIAANSLVGCWCWRHCWSLTGGLFEPRELIPAPQRLPNNIMHPTRNREIDSGSRSFGRVMMSVGQTRCDCTSLDNSLVAGRIFYGTLH